MASYNGNNKPRMRHLTLVVAVAVAACFCIGAVSARPIGQTVCAVGEQRQEIRDACLEKRDGHCCETFFRILRDAGCQKVVAKSLVDFYGVPVDLNEVCHEMNKRKHGERPPRVTEE